MDIQLEKKRGIQKKHLPYVGGGVLFLALVGWIIFGDRLLPGSTVPQLSAAPVRLHERNH